QMRPELVQRKLMHLCQEFGCLFHIGGRRLARSRDVQLYPIARCENHRFAMEPVTELIEGSCQPRFCERKALAHVQRRRTEAAPKREEFHGPPPPTTVCEAARVHTSKTKATIVSIATRRARR